MFAKTLLCLSKNCFHSRAFVLPKRPQNFPEVVLGHVSPMNAVPQEILKPSYYYDGFIPASNAPAHAHSPEGVQKMRKACQITKKVMDFVDTLVQPGVSTDEIDREMHKYACSLGYYPGPLNYGHFPKSISSSVNDVCCHGIPDDRKLQDGDILKMDMVMFVDGYYGDMTRCYAIGNVDENGKKLIKCTHEAMDEAIKVCKPGANYSDIGDAISRVCNKYKYRPVFDLGGHGVGTELHELPYIIHTKNSYPGRMMKNQTFTIEPIIVEYANTTYIDEDDSTVRTSDGGRAAQLEHTILITDNGCEVLTA
ncbi:hypothetical protein WA158_004092 [Blastocystis sp. Blastoise]